MKPIYVRVPRTASGTFVRLHGSEVTGPLDHTPTWKLAELFPDWAERHTFGFIRNPWDWLVSVYNSGISVGVWQHEPWPGMQIEPPDNPYLQHAGQRMNCTFAEWVRLRDSTPIDWLTDRSGAVIVKEIRLFETFIAALPAGTERHNAFVHKPYREWYDADTREYVREKCAREIEVGGYSF